MKWSAKKLEPNFSTTTLIFKFSQKLYIFVEQIEIWNPKIWNDSSSIKCIQNPWSVIQFLCRFENEKWSKFFLKMKYFLNESEYIEAKRWNHFFHMKCLGKISSRSYHSVCYVNFKFEK